MVVILDMSLSMTGDKIALTALAAAILRLKLDHIAVVCFDTKAHELVAMAEPITPEDLVRRILRVPAQGFTNVNAGLKMGLDQLRQGGRRERVGIVMTDGVANVDGDPVRRAAAFPLLHVVQVGEKEVRGTRACSAMPRAAAGAGTAPGCTRTCRWSAASCESALEPESTPNVRSGIRTLSPPEPPQPPRKPCPN